MLHGLLWLPLLVIFFGLAGAGWNEYQKLETYREWAAKFDRAKYDIYAVLGQNGDVLTWGKPKREGIVQTETCSLKAVKAIRLLVNNQPVDLQSPPSKGRSIALQFELPDASIQVPFTQVSLAARWGQVLTEDWQKLRSTT